ncbi:MAG TPA: amino acid adenylation domain-containing protein [Micromonosporaceae bacterium]
MTSTSVNPLNDRLTRLTPQQRARLRRALKDQARNAEPGEIPRVDRSGRLPMSCAQRRHYVLQKLRPESPAYNNIEAVRLRGSLDVTALHAALANVVARHEVLRTRCSPGDGDDDAGLVVADPDVAMEGLGIEVVELPRPGSLDDARELFADRVERPFDLDRDFPLRVTLARISALDHALLFVTHHIATDAWSCRLLLDEFFQAYTRAVTGTGAGPEPLAIEYADYAAWQRSQLSTDGTRDHLDYWRERLAGMPPTLELPLEHLRPPVRDDHGAEIHLDLDRRTRGRLRATARDAAVTPFAVLLTAFGYVLHRHCATDDVVLGTPVAGRDRVELERLIGCFVNTVVLRLDFGDQPTRRDLVRRVWQRSLRDFEHQGLPFEHLVAELGAERDLSAGELVQVMFNYYPATRVREPVPELDVRPLDVQRARAKFDLTCTVVDSPDRIRVTVNYATDLLHRTLAVRLGSHFVRVLNALLDDLDAPAATLPGVPPGDPAPRTDARPRLPAPSVLSRFETHTRAYPERIAVRCLDRAVSYRELNHRANRLARHLRGRTSGPVGLLFERSVEYVVAMLAAMKAGLTYLPLDPAMPAGHIAAVLREAGVGLLLTHSGIDVAGLPELVDVVAVDRIAAQLASHSGADLDRSVGDDEPMYLLFTSGSTGRPKGVVVEHRHLARYLDSVIQRMALPDGLSYAMVSTFAADLGLTNLYGALATGGTLHVLPYEWASAPERFAGYVRRHRIDVMKLAPSHLAAVAEAGLLDAVVPARHLILAGEACPWDLVDAIREARPECTVWNHYGPTETTVSVLAYRVPDEPPTSRGATVPLGHALDHVRAYVVDRELRPVPRGAAGELLITGGGVARGYLSPDGTADRFIADPFSTVPNSRAYRSGDRVRVRHDGSLEFLGRMDRQVKIRGHRVEPGYVAASPARNAEDAAAMLAARQSGDPIESD